MMTDTNGLAQRVDSTKIIKISKDSLDTKVEYGAKDSMKFDNINNLVYLYGEAYVNYEGLSLTADYIEVDIDSSIAYAAAGQDSVGKVKGVPEFQDGPQKFNAMRMKYNFKSKKGLVYEAVTQESDIYVRGTKTKYVAGNDSLGTDDMIFNRNAIFTTCNHPEPHYGVRSLKQKLIPNKLVVVGPSIVEIAGVPTPLVLPFAFFPLTKGRRSGLLLPRDYEYSEQWGFGLREIGYYIPINDYMDTRIMGDIYFNGSWGLSTETNYKKRYKYNGRLNLAYSSRKTEVRGDYREEEFRSIKIFWQHAQNNKANPFHNFSGNIDFEINRFDQLNQNEANAALDNSLRSTVTYRRLFPDRPFTLTMALKHDQNNNTRDVNISFPDLKFNVRRIQPFKRKRAIATKKWYDEIGVTYGVAAKARYQTKDSLLLQKFDPSRLDYGLKHDVDLSANYNILKYLLFNTSVNYDEFWHFRQIRKNNSGNEIITIDTVDTDPFGNPVEVRDTMFGEVLIDTLQQFSPFRTASISTGLSTKLFGTARFKKGPIRGIRHVMTPSVSMSYSPNTRNSDFGYWRAVRKDFRTDTANLEEYSVFINSSVGVPRPSEQSLALNFRIDNTFETKYFSKRDSAESKIRLLDNISLFTNYDINRDSLKWQMIGLSTFTKLFKGFSSLSFGMRMDPYAVVYDRDGRQTRINESSWKRDKKLLRFDRMDLDLTTIFSIGQIADMIKGKGQKDGSLSSPKDGNQENNNQSKRKTAQNSESLLDIFSNFRVNHTINFGYVAQEGGDTLIIDNHFIDIRGNLQISPSWGVTLGRIGYNFKTKRITYPDVGFTRDLHCWTLDFRWQPERGTYSLFVGVKPGSMDFLKIPYRKNNIDTFF